MHLGPSPPPNPYAPHPQWAPRPPPPTRSSGNGRLFAFGCGGAVLLAAIGGVMATFLVGSRIFGTSLASVPVSPGARTSLTFTDPGKGTNAAWLELDVAHTQGLRLMGMFTVTAGGRVIGQYNLDGDLSGPCDNPVAGQRSSTCVNWSFSQSGASGTVSGRTKLFEIPAQPSGTAVSVIGTLYLASGVTARRLVLTVRD